MAKERLNKNFFSRDTKILAEELLGKILVRKINGKTLRAKIVETEAYFDEKDPASWARFGKKNYNNVMWGFPGIILIKNVHKYKMFNIVSGRENKAEAVLIRALEPLNFKARLSGPGLLTESLFIDKRFHGKNVFSLKDLFIEEDKDLNKFEINESFRIGVTKDLPEKLRFYIKGNKHVSRK